MVTINSPAVVEALAYFLMLAGLVGAVVPLVPGPVLIWLGAALWAWNDGFRAVGIPTLAVLGVLVVVGWGLDLFFTATISRQAGASWRSVGAAILLGFVGGAIGSAAAPVMGSVLGAAVGAVVGMVIVEYLIKRRWSTALRSSGGYLAGCLIAKGAEVALALAMIAIFVWQAFFAPL
jgi:uncharacterized protein YqgC (DUF456 family)